MKAMTWSCSTIWRTMASVRAGSALSSPRITRTGWPLIPPLALIQADHARRAGGAGPDTAPRTPDSAPKDPNRISDFGPPLPGTGAAGAPGAAGVPAAADFPAAVAPAAAALFAPPPAPPPAEGPTRMAPVVPAPDPAAAPGAAPADRAAPAPVPPPGPAVAPPPAPAAVAPVVPAAPAAPAAAGPAARLCWSTTRLKALLVDSSSAWSRRDPHPVRVSAAAAPTATSTRRVGLRNPAPSGRIVLGRIDTPEPSAKLTESSLSLDAASMAPGGHGARRRPAVGRSIWALFSADSAVFGAQIVETPRRRCRGAARPAGRTS